MCGSLVIQRWKRRQAFVDNKEAVYRVLLPYWGFSRNEVRIAEAIFLTDKPRNDGLWEWVLMEIRLLFSIDPRNSTRPEISRAIRQVQCSNAKTQCIASCDA